MANENHSTLSFKLDNDFRDEVKKMLDESPMNNKDWFAKAVQLMKVQSMKEQSMDFASDLNELEVNTTRIFELVSNMVQRSVVLRESAVRDLEQKLEQQREITAEYQIKVKVAIEEKNQAFQDLEQLKGEQSELTKQLDELRETLETNKLLVNEYKNTNDSLASLVTKYEGYATQNEQLKETLTHERNSHQSAIDGLNRQNSEMASIIKDLEQQINTLKQTHEATIEHLSDKHELDKEKTLLQVERSHQKALTEANTEYTNKVQSLYENMDKQRQAYEQKIVELERKLTQKNNEK